MTFFVKALRDCNKIWGVISKTAVNQDGHSVTPITKPSMVQQEELLRRIYSNSDIMNVQYIEAHGTGTLVGDPIEAGSISNVIAKPTRSETLLIGSLKGNIGHTESAAGVAGLIKVLLMMKHSTIVPSVFYSEDSSSIDVKALNLSIPTKSVRWETNGPMGRVAGINSFGFGGTNAHVIVRQYTNATVPSPTPKDCTKVFVISAASEKSLSLSISDTHERLCRNQSVDLRTLSYTSACRRSHYKHKYRKAFLISSLSDLEHQLMSALKAKVQAVRSNIQVVFVFCGNGIAYKGMCRQLMSKLPVFSDKVREIETLFQSHGSFSMSRWLSSEHDNNYFNEPNVVQPLLFAIQVSIATLLKHWGIKPDAVLGHSVGEVAAAHCSGLLSLDNAVKVLYHRSTLQGKVKGGKMLVVGNVAVDKVLKILPNFTGKISVAAFNSPQSCTLSGDAHAIDTLHERLKSIFKDETLFLHVLDVPAAYHSHMMDPVLEDIKRRIDVLDTNNIECKLFSTVTGDKCSDGDFSSGTYWAKNIREPVLFEQTLRAAIKDKSTKGNVVFVEIGPRRALHRNICETLGNDTVVLPTANPDKDYGTILSTVAKLFELGMNVDWHKLYRGLETLPTALPVYQFDNTKKDLNFESVRKGDEHSSFTPHTLISQIKRDNKEFMSNLSSETVPYLWEHKNNSISIVPGSFYVELAFASVMASFKPRKTITQLHLSVRFESVLTLNSHSQQLKVRVEHGEKEGSFAIQSSNATHASGRYTYQDIKPLLEESNICPRMIFQRCKLVWTRNEIYSILSQAGFEYGPLFKQLDDVHFGDEFKEAVMEIQVPGDLLKHLHDYFIHPVLLDYFLQMTAMLAMGQLTVKQGFPSGITDIVISAPLQEEMIMYLRATQETPDYTDVCGCFSTREGNVLVELKGVRISFVGCSSNVSQSLFFQNEAVAVEEELQNGKIRAIVFEDNLCIAKGLEPYLHPESITVESKEHLKAYQVRNLVLQCLTSRVDVENILFLWGVDNLTYLSSEKMLDCLMTCCEIFRHIVLAVKESKRSCSVHVITYRSSEMCVDHVSPGFALSGMIRACAAELADLSFQLIDLASVTSENIQTLAQVINTCRHQEVWISKGKAAVTKMARTRLTDKALFDGETHSVNPRDFVLHSTDPYSIAHLSATHCDTNGKALQEKTAEIQLISVCLHSSDYFPVTTSQLIFGKAMYWNKHTSLNHRLLALDFSGIVTAVGKNVNNLRVGDHIASCYPVHATSKIVIPEAVCYNIKTFPFLKETPCVSYFILAWEILQSILFEDKKQHRKLTIVSPNSGSALTKVLALTATRSGWSVSSQSHFTGEPPCFDESHAFVLLPPFDAAWQEMYDNGALEKHMIFVFSSHMPPSVSDRLFTPKSEHIHVHKLDVDYVLQKAYLQARSRNICNWLKSLGFDTGSLPLRRELYLYSDSKVSWSRTKPESYFTTETVQQIVLGHEESCSLASEIPMFAMPRQLFKQSCTYIVTGGLSGLGLETVKFLAHNGGACIATLSRRRPSDKTQFEMDLLQKRYRVAIINIQCDVSVMMQVVDAISKIGETFPCCPIKGVFHSAAVLHDALIESLDESLFRKVLQPKVCGALNLHYATLHNKLDFFVCYSSISSVIGNASQCNYGAANSFLDLFCHYRRNLGLSAQSINWGPLNLGLLLNKDHLQKFLEAKGMMIMDVCEVHETLKKSLLMNRPQQVICKFSFKNLSIHVLSQNGSLRKRLLPLVEMELKDEVHNKPKIPSSSTYEHVRNIVSEIINVSAEELDHDSNLCALGIDSMLAMTLQNKIFQETGVNIPLVVILDPNSTLTSLVTNVLKSE